jgi:hypothetical protein
MCLSHPTTGSTTYHEACLVTTSTAIHAITAVPTFEFAPGSILARHLQHFLQPAQSPLERKPAQRSKDPHKMPRFVRTGELSVTSSSPFVPTGINSREISSLNSATASTLVSRSRRSSSMNLPATKIVSTAKRGEQLYQRHGLGALIGSCI